MHKVIRHKWKEQDGFRIDECEHCHCTRKWDDGFKRMVYFTAEGHGPYFFPPYCKRAGVFCDKI